VRRSVDERKREACFFLGRPQGRALLRGRARPPDRNRGRTDRYVAELIGSGVDSEQAIRWLIALMVLCCDPLPKPLTAADARQNSDRARHQHPRDQFNKARGAGAIYHSRICRRIVPQCAPDSAGETWALSVLEDAYRSDPRLSQEATADDLSLYLTDATVEVTVMKAFRLKRVAPLVGATKLPKCAIRPAKPKRASTVLVIDCDPQTRRFVSAGLKFYDYSVCQAENGSEGLKSVARIRPAVIILDPALPDMSGIEVLQTIRSLSNAPVIVTSVETDEDHKVHFLRTGADNYMVKPFGIAELAARCEVALRHYHKAADNDPVVRTGLLTIDLVSRAVTLDSRSVTLTRQEYRLLHLLASHLGLVITHNQLIRDIWGDPSPEIVQYLRSLVRKLRQKIEADPTKPSS
jgi:two-component system, OmpR family, KDP operon response regulator KdpE